MATCRDFIQDVHRRSARTQDIQLKDALDIIEALSHASQQKLPKVPMVTNNALGEDLKDISERVENTISAFVSNRKSSKTNTVAFSSDSALSS